jgi:hypothetical protein
MGLGLTLFTKRRRSIGLDDLRERIEADARPRAMFRNVNTGKKLTILCLTFIIAIAVPIYSLLQYRQNEVELLSRELVGSRYVAILRGIYASVLTSAPNTPLPLRSTASSDEVLNALKVAEANSGGMMQTARARRGPVLC